MPPEEPSSASSRTSRDGAAAPGLAGRVVGSLADAGLRAGGRVANRLGLGDVARTAMDRALAGPIAERMTQQLIEQGVIERVAAELIEGGVPNRVIDQVLASDLPEEVIDRVLAEEFAQRVVARVLESPGVEPAAVDVIESDLVDELTKRVLESEEMKMTIERVAESPEVRNALARQGVGLIEDVGAQVSSLARRLDGAVEVIPRKLFRRDRRASPPREAGAVSRLLAIAVDALVLNAFLFAASVAVALALSLVGDTSDNVSTGFAVAAGGLVWTVGAATYLGVFWTLAGQTPGMRFMRLHLTKVDGSSLSSRDSVRRLLGMVLAAIPLFLGYALILVNDRRRGLQDRVAHTVVRSEPDEMLALPPGQQDARGLPRPAPGPPVDPSPPPGYHGSSQREPTTKG